MESSNPVCSACHKRLRPTRGKFIDLTGKQFGKWRVVSRSSEVTAKQRQPYFTCICACGRKGNIASQSLRQGKSTQCIECKYEAHQGWWERKKEKNKSG